MNKDTDWLNYDALYREYDPRQGRWISPDPAGLAAVDPTDPQSWNRYAYVENNPLSFTDPLGLIEPTCVHVPCPTGWQGGGGGGGGGIGAGDLLFLGIPVYGPDSIFINDGPVVSCLSGCYGFLNVSLTSNNSPANNSRNCTPTPASAGQYVAATAQVAAMTSEFFSGLGPGNLTFGPGSSTSQVMAQSGPVQDVLNSYYMTGQTSGLYTFGGSRYVAAGGNPVAQFVGSFRWSIAPGDGGINLSLTNTTSFRSLTYDMGPQWQRGSVPTPMGNTHQTYNITAKCQ
jgi:RHS repeat-associated protein